MQRLFHRIYFSLLLATFVAIGLTAAVTHHLLGERHQSPFVGRLLAEARSVERRLPPPGASEADARSALALAAGDLNLDLTLVARDGRSLATTRPGITPLHGWPEATGWTMTRSGPVFVVLLADGRRLALRPREHPGRQLMYLVVVAVLFTILGVAARPTARRLTRRLEALERGVERLGAGDFSARVAVEGRDEVARLAERFNAAAERIERLIERERRVLASASHELRSPLARLRLALELIRQEGGQAAAGRIAEAVADIGELDELVEDVLLASRLEAGRRGPLEEIDLASLVNDEAARFDVRSVTRPARVVGEARPLRRLVRNLLENARRHGAGAEIEAGVEPLADGGVRLWVADRGPGVRPEERERIFEPFYRRARGDGEAGDGVGLGLALVRQIAEAHGGSAACHPREGGGTTFEVTLRSAAVP